MEDESRKEREKENIKRIRKLKERQQKSEHI